MTVIELAAFLCYSYYVCLRLSVLRWPTLLGYCLFWQPATFLLLFTCEIALANKTDWIQCLWEPITSRSHTGFRLVLKLVTLNGVTTADAHYQLVTGRNNIFSRKVAIFCSNLWFSHIYNETDLAWTVSLTSISTAHNIPLGVFLYVSQESLQNSSCSQHYEIWARCAHTHWGREMTHVASLKFKGRG